MADSSTPVGLGGGIRLLGLGLTFFSGATEAGLVDALGATGSTDNLETVFGRAQTVGGAAMLAGSVGGVVDQAANLGVPYLLRAAMLGVTLAMAFRATCTIWGSRQDTAHVSLLKCGACCVVPLMLVSRTRRCAG